MCAWTGVHGPGVFRGGVEDERSMYFLCVGALVLAIAAVVSLRRSRFGRVVIAVRENGANAESAGISVVRMKLTPFAFSGALAGFSGAIFAVQQRRIAAPPFTPRSPIDV